MTGFIPDITAEQASTSSLKKLDTRRQDRHDNSIDVYWIQYVSTGHQDDSDQDPPGLLDGL